MLLKGGFEIFGSLFATSIQFIARDFLGVLSDHAYELSVVDRLGKVIIATTVQTSIPVASFFLTILFQLNIGLDQLIPNLGHGQQSQEAGLKTLPTCMLLTMKDQ